jgi:crossover junction endodeoxyribonuclease RuvC
MGLLIGGIDPGFTGALAFLNPATGKIVDVMDVPVIETKTGKRRVDVWTLAKRVDVMAEYVEAAALEAPGAMPGQGVSSMFRFGETCGIIEGVLVANFIKLHRVAPAKWKRDLNVPAGKDEARALASRLWPDSAGLWARKKDDGRAEAALLARWLWKIKQT